MCIRDSFSKQFNNHFDSDESDDDMKGCYNLFAVDKCEDSTDCPFCTNEIDLSDTDDGCEWTRCSWVEWAMALKKQIVMMML